MEKKKKNIEILQIPDGIGYWLLRADGGKYYEDFFLNNFVAISDNEITLNSILDEKKMSIAGITIDHYKDLYRNCYPDWSNQQIAHAAGRTEKFIDQIKVGDLVLVPSKRSTDFLLGVITSDVFEIKEEEVSSGEKIHYTVTPFLKRRRVKWLKEIPRSDLSENLYWVLSAHQTIFDLKEDKNYINQLLSPMYIQNGICHGTIRIGKEEGLNSDDWFGLYSVIKEISDHTSDDVIIKSNVQSPGLLELVSIDFKTIVSITIVLSGVLVGDFNFFGVKFKGIFPAINEHKKQKADIKKTEKEIDLMEEDQKAKQIANERAQFELEKERKSWIKVEETEVQLHEELRISSFDAGRKFSNQTQKDSSENLNADEF